MPAILDLSLDFDVDKSFEIPYSLHQKKPSFPTIEVNSSFNPFLMAMAYQTTIAYAPFFWYPKRDVPSLEYSNISHFDRLKSASSSVSSAITNLTLTNTGPKFNYGNLYFNHDSMTGGQAILFRNSNNSGWIAISSEL